MAQMMIMLSDIRIVWLMPSMISGNAIGSSTTLALALERADPFRRGKQMATFSIAYPLSYGVGSVITGSTIEFAGYTGMFLAMAAVQAIGLIFALVQAQNLRSQTA